MDRRQQKTKAAIQNAYFSLVAEKNTVRVTVADIARRANIDRKTFYLHYETVEDIIREFSADRVRELLLVLERDEFFERPFDAGQLFRSLDSLILEDQEFFRRIVKTPAFSIIWTDVQDVLIRTIKEVYGEITDVSMEELDVYARFFASGIISLYTAWLRQEIPFDIDRLGALAADISYYGAKKIIPSVQQEDVSSLPQNGIPS